MSPSQNRYIHGVMIPAILKSFGLEVTRESGEWMKKVLKKFAGVDSFRDLSDAGASRFIERIAILLAGEAGIVFDLPGEIDAEEQDMREFLKHIYK